MSGCQKCKALETATCPTNFEPSDIRFCQVQMFWLIYYLETLEEGYWPELTIEQSKVALGKHAPFESSVLCAAVINQRLKTTGDAGKALVGEIQRGEIKDYDFLSSPAQEVMKYIRGKRNKKDTFPQWRADKKRRNP